MTEPMFIYLRERIPQLKADRSRIRDRYEEHQWPEEATELERLEYKRLGQEIYQYQAKIDEHVKATLGL